MFERGIEREGRKEGEKASIKLGGDRETGWILEKLGRNGGVDYDYKFPKGNKNTAFFKKEG